MLPARALPVPFCLYSLAPEPVTSLRPLVEAVERRRELSSATTARWMMCSLGSVSNRGPLRSMEDFLPLRASNMCAWAILLARLPDLDDRAPAAGHAAAYPELVPLGVHRDDLEVPHRGSLVAHLARHALALEDASRVRRRTDGAGLPDVVRAV